MRSRSHAHRVVPRSLGTAWDQDSCMHNARVWLPMRPRTRMRPHSNCARRWCAWDQLKSLCRALTRSSKRCPGHRGPYRGSVRAQSCTEMTPETHETGTESVCDCRVSVQFCRDSVSPVQNLGRDATEQSTEL
jgi:hypothetical protein